MHEKKTRTNMTRRDFLRIQAAAGAILWTGTGWSRAENKTPVLKFERLLGKLEREEADAPLPQGVWYKAHKVGDGIEYRFPKGTLKESMWLTADTLLDGRDLTVFYLSLYESGSKKVFRILYGLLAQCSARIRISLRATDMNRWRLEREGAWLKPIIHGNRIDLAKVDRATLTVKRMTEKPVRFCLTPLKAASSPPEKLKKLVLPKGPLIDELGQMATANWPGKSRSRKIVSTRLKAQLRRAEEEKWPESFTKWGGWRSRRVEKKTGFFSRHNDGKRWWLVDPDGHLFWSAGVDCVRVDATAHIGGLESALAWLPEKEGKYADAYGKRGELSYLAANCIEAFGARGWREDWAKVALAQSRRIGFNTVGNWSEWEIARAARFPYVRPMSFYPRRIKRIYRDFPDVYDPAFERDAADYANLLKETANDPSLIGYFMMNEPQWAFSSELPAEGMLYTAPECRTREALANFLKEKYGAREAFAKAWEIDAGFDRVAAGKWTFRLNGAARDDLRIFSERMTEHYFRVLSEACRRVDPNHLNLGMRWAGVPPKWAVKGMQSLDVFSMNCYKQRIPAKQVDEIHAMLKMPVMIGEYHFGALDAGLPASGIGRVATQADRGRAYRVYLEDAAANPYCVGAHWFTLYDQSALGRFDGENYNIGFLDICHRRHEAICSAGLASHKRLYEVASGKIAPYADAPEHLPRIFI